MGQWHVGINLGHDRSVAIVQEGKIAVAIEQERLDRKKHSVGMALQAPGEPRGIEVPWESLRYCLDTVGLSLGDIATFTANMPGDDLGATLLTRKIAPELVDRIRSVPSHHLAHAYTAFWPSGFDEALVLVIDASGSTQYHGGRVTESYSMYRGGPKGLTPVHSEMVLAHLAQLSTLGFLYEYVTRKAGFVTKVGPGLQYAEAGKLMGLAPYGGPQDGLDRWIHAQSGELSLDIPAYDIFLEIAALEKRYEGESGPRHLRPWLVDLAFKVQSELELAIKHLVEVGMQKTGLDRLCMAGGVALNSVSNYRVLRDLPLRDIFVFPAAGDNGIAAGCALWAYAEDEGGRQRPPLTSATLGRSVSDETISRAVAAFDDMVIAERLPESSVASKVGEALARGRIVARFEGGSEYGPRALGHRSILADPTFARMKDVINGRVKFREAYRPFAPVIPLERAKEVFKLKVPSPYMLLVADIHPDMHSVLPAITHHDGTGRIQTCTAQDNPFFYALCHELERRRGGPPVLLNTSFNVAGQPIVETPEEAIQTFLRTDIDHLSIGSWWLKKRGEEVKDYADHLHLVKDTTMPHGLPPQTEGVGKLMDQLDRALFANGSPGPWTAEEIVRLSAEGARWRERSRRYPGSPYVAPVKTMLSDRIVLILDPHSGARIADGENPEKSDKLGEDDVEVVLGLVASMCGDLAERLRLRLGLTHAELRSKIQQMSLLLRHYGVPHSMPGVATSVAADRVDYPRPDEAVAAAFASPQTCCRASLTRLREQFDAAGYDEDELCALLGVESLQQIQPTELRRLDRWVLPETQLADLARLFLLRAEVSAERSKRALSREGLDFCVAHGLVRPSTGGFVAMVDIFCSGGLRLMTDHRYHLRQDDRLGEDPVMYIGMDSHGLVQTAPRESCRRALDLCCGSGIQGLVASRYAEHVVAVDINPRAIRFARFNQQFNGIENYECRLGSLYGPVSGDTFDVILANPPFVPSPRTDTRFRDGGASGEEVLRAIIEGAAGHMTTEGRLAIVTDLVDVRTYPDRLRKWWTGEERTALILHTADRDEHLFTVPHVHRPFGQTLASFEADYDDWITNFRAAGLKQVNFGYILVWKGEPDSVTLRTINNPARPIHHHVSRWLEQRRRRLSVSETDAAYHLSVHPGLTFIETRDITQDVTKVDITVPNDAFFTTYSINPDIAASLRALNATRPKLEARWNDQDAPWLNDLLDKNILLLLEEDGAKARGESAINGILLVEEQPTKTTPTCLSSYLR